MIAAEIERKASNALIYTLIGLPCLAIPSIIGFFMAVTVFTALQRTGVRSPAAHTKATWAVLIGALGAVIWTVVLIASSDLSASYP